MKTLFSYKLEDFKKIDIICNDCKNFLEGDDWTLDIEMLDGGSVIIDIQFSYSGEKVDIDENFEKQSKQLNDFLNALHSGCGLVDWFKYIIQSKIARSKN